MEVGEKPFPCKVPGCKVSFATEDHLNAHHQNRHESTTTSSPLNLELPSTDNKSNNLFADQTPTPTRFFGKCEEVGLFEDLQNVNPFEETFRRAVEEKEEGEEGGTLDTGTPAGTGDDTLHTPQVFPLLERRESIKERTYKLSKLFIARSVSRKDEVTVVGGSSGATPSTADLKRKSNDSSVLIAPKKAPVPILPKLTTPVQPDTTTSISGANDTDSDPVKIRLKKYLARNGATSGEVEASSTTPKKVAKQSTEIPRIISKLPERNSAKSQEEDKETTEKHERWKAAAKRYRTRLKQNQDMIAQRNVALEEENAKLKAEVVRLRNLLQLHKDCEVTRALSGTAGTVATAGPSKVVVPAIVQQPKNQPVYILIAGPPAAVAQNQLPTQLEK